MLEIVSCELKMIAQLYYYTDSNFQLELNLQEVRRELIQMIEEFEDAECFTCNKLKCCCLDHSCSSLSELEIDTRKSIRSQEVKMKNVASSEASHAPPAHTLPKPTEWDVEDSNGTSKSEQFQYKEVEDWVRASTPTAETKIDKKFAAKEIDKTFTIIPSKQSDDLLNHSWPLPKSKLDRKMDLNTLIGRYQASNPVETFFKNFRQGERPMFAGQLTRQQIHKTAAALMYKLKPKNKSYAYF